MATETAIKISYNTMERYTATTSPFHHQPPPPPPPRSTTLAQWLLPRLLSTAACSKSPTGKMYAAASPPIEIPSSRNFVVRSHDDLLCVSKSFHSTLNFLKPPEQRDRSTSEPIMGQSLEKPLEVGAEAASVTVVQAGTSKKDDTGVWGWMTTTPERNTVRHSDLNVIAPQSL